MLRSFFGLFLKEAFLIEHGLINSDGAIFITGLHFARSIFHLAVERAFALLHFAVDQLLNVCDFEFAIRVFDFIYRRAVSLRQHGDRQLRFADQFVGNWKLAVRYLHRHTLRSVERQGARFLEARILVLVTRRWEPIQHQPCGRRSGSFFPRYDVYRRIRATATSAIVHAAATAAATATASGP